MDSNGPMMFYCHSCENTFRLLPPTANRTNGNPPPAPVCTECGDEFVEELTAEDDPRLFLHRDTGSVDDDNSDEDVQLIDDDVPRQPEDVMRIFQQVLTNLMPGPVLNADPNNDINVNQPQQRNFRVGPMNFTLTANGMHGVPANGDGAQQPRPDFDAMLRAMLGAQSGDDENNPLAQLFGMVGNAGDYVFDQHGVDDIITRLMEEHTARNGPPPASASAISQLKQHYVTDQDILQVDGRIVECAVCQEAYSSGEKVTLLPVCLHAFHGPCIQEWLKINGTCPICRSSLVPPSPSQEQLPPD